MKSSNPLLVSEYISLVKSIFSMTDSSRGK
jgi:hypothetical protein